VLSGKIKVNGKGAAPGFAVGSGDTVETAKGSSAVVSLGKLGRVQVLPGSKMKVTFDDVSFTVSLESGAALVSKAEGMTATVSTKDAEVVATTPLAGSFTVDTGCGNSIVTAHDASVELRTGDETYVVMPGSQRSAGRPRVGCKPKPAKQL
jgi:ferric-dicitrate binding protein FerR (iron transport regulator)